MDWFSDPNAWLGLLTLTALEIVLGIDNIIFISILAGKLPRSSSPGRDSWGSGAFVTRSAPASIAWIVRLTRPLFTVVGHAVSGRDLILLLGGLFLIGRRRSRSTTSSRARKGTSRRRARLARRASSCRSC